MRRRRLWCPAAAPGAAGFGAEEKEHARSKGGPHNVLRGDTHGDGGVARSDVRWRAAMRAKARKWMARRRLMRTDISYSNSRIPNKLQGVTTSEPTILPPMTRGIMCCRQEQGSRATPHTGGVAAGAGSVDPRGRKTRPPPGTSSRAGALTRAAPAGGGPAGGGRTRCRGRRRGETASWTTR